MESSRIARWGSAVAAALGGLALLGWVTGTPSLTQLVAGEPVMAPETAVGLIVSAGAVACELRRPALTRCATILAIVPVAITAIAVGAWRSNEVESLFHPALPRHSLTVVHAMAAGAAASFLLFGAALLLSRSRSRRLERLFDVCAASLLTIATFSLFASTYHWLEIPADWPFRIAALPASLAFIALGVAVLSLRPDRGAAAAMLDPGPTGVLLRHLVPAVVLVPAVLGPLHGWAAVQTGRTAALGLASYLFGNLALLTLVIARSAREVRRLEADSVEANRRLVASEEAYRRTFLDVPAAVVTLGKDLRVRSANPVTGRLLGYDQDDLVGMHISELAHPDDYQAHEASVMALLEGSRDTFTVEGRFRAKDGHLLHGAVDARAVRDEQGRAMFAVAVIEDITARKRSEEALIESEARFRLMTNASPQIVWTAAPDGAIDHLSSEWERYGGCTAGDGLGACWRSRIHPDDVERTAAAWKRSVETGEPYELEYRLRRRDGVYRWFLSRAMPGRDDRGRIVKWYGADTDIHELHETKEALRTNEARFRVALHRSPVVVTTQDKELRYTWLHNASARYQPERSLGKTDRELLERPEDGELISAIKQRVIDTGEGMSTSVRLVVDGELRDFELSLEPLRDARGEIVGVAGAGFDVTERVRVEDALRRAQRLESLGALAGGLAHGYNNLLTVALGNATLLRQAVERSAIGRTKAAALLDEIIDACDAAASLTRQLLAYSGKGRFFIESVDLAALVEEVTRRLRSTVSPNVELRVDVDASSTARVEADAAELRQLLANLVVNAVEAIGESRGTVTVRVTRRELESGSTDAQNAGVPPGAYCALEVSDDGPGIAPEAIGRIFDPFYTTKLFGRGLGLAAAQGIARAHGGSIRATSGLDRGTLFQVLLPAAVVEEAAFEAAEASSGVHPAVPASGGGVVLFVDDEEPVRRVAEIVLRDAGYEVLLAEHGEAALAIAEGRLDEIDAVVLDMTMPVLGGAETAERLRALCPDVRIIASSGYSEAEVRAQFASTRPEFLRKPYRPSELLAKVRAVRGHRRELAAQAAPRPAISPD